MAEKPTTPIPTDTDTGLAIDTVLTWTDGGNSDKYQVYFGTDQTKVTNGDTSVYRGDVTTELYDPRVFLTYGQTYHWRIDAVEGGQTAVGDVWSFTVVTEGAGTPAGKKYRKRWCALANNQFWYENDEMPSEMIALSGLNIDTSKPIDMFEGWQKIFIVNEITKKVVDFSNTKITGTLTGTLTRGMELAVGGGASMIVDFWDGGTSNAVIYGFRTTTTAFANTEVATGKNDNDEDVSITLTANEVPPVIPHHYDWTVFGNDTETYGNLPEQATIAALYRGRPTLAGDPNRPHQWSMARQDNPFDWLYAHDDAQSPVSGSDADVGKIGDIVVAVVPYEDDYLLFGCAGSWWIVRGDPAAGGSLDQLDFEVGIVGKNAWCWDTNRNLYFIGGDGLYKIGSGLSAFQNLTMDVMPDFLDDLNYNPEIHDLTLAFDARKNGIVITRTLREDGSNKGYWYSLKTGGFFPETYPNECGVMSAGYYNSDQPDYRRLFIGCFDGYIRYFDDEAKNDDIGIATQIIDSYALIGPIQIAKDSDRHGKLTSLTIVTGGGASGGVLDDTDGLDYEGYVSNTAAEIIENVNSGTKQFNGSCSVPGRDIQHRHRARGVCLGLLLKNDQIDQTWAFEKALATVLPVGRAR